MSTRARGTFEVKSWHEVTFEEIREGSKLNRASITQIFRGDIEAEGASELLLAYPGDGTATFVGLQRVVGRLGGRSGSVMLQGNGRWAGGTASMTWSVIPGSGEGELRGLRGEGGYSGSQSEHPSVAYTLDYNIGDAP